jgi:O-antigen ligase
VTALSGGATAPAHAVRAELLLIALGLVGATMVWVPAPLIGIEQFRLPKELAILGITLAASMALWRAERWRVDRVTLLAMACLAWALLSLWLRADNAWLGWRLLSGYWCALVAYVVVRQYSHCASARALLLASVAGAGAAVAVTTLLEQYGVVAGISLLHRAPSGVFGHRNHAGHFVALTLPAALALLRLDATREDFATRTARIACGLGLCCAMLGGAAIVVTRSRAAWLAVGAAVVVVGLTLLRARAEGCHVDRGTTWTSRRAGAAWLVAVFVGALFGATVPSSLEWRWSLLSSVRRVTEFEQGSGRGRLVQYSTTLSMARANPLLGVGPGNWTVEYPRFASRGDPNLIPGPAPAPRLPLSDWLATLSELGAPVLLGVACLALLVVRPAAVALARARRTGRVRIADVALLALLVEVLLLGSLDAVVQTPLAAVVVATLAAVLARRMPGASPLRLSARVQRVAATAAVVTSLFLAALAGRRLNAAMQYGDDLAPAAFRAAAAIDPTDFTAQFFAGYAYVRARDCRSAAPYLRAAIALRPSSGPARALGRRCANGNRPALTQPHVRP